MLFGVQKRKCINIFQRKKASFHLCGNGREFERLERFVIGGGTRVDVDHHARAPVTTEETLEDPG